MGLLLFAGCKSEYQQLVESELAKGTRVDTIFLGMTFGMTREAFYKHCWDMNRRGMFLNGPKNNTVEYDISRYLSHPGKVYFYPTFYEDKIYEMPVSFAYDAFAWHDDYGVDTLLNDILKMYKGWYGDFKEFKHPDKGSVYVNINGNRQIRLFKDELNQSVGGVFTDLSIDKDKVRLAQQQPAQDTLNQ